MVHLMHKLQVVFKMLFDAGTLELIPLFTMEQLQDYQLQDQIQD